MTVALVTGGESGIGAACARRLAKAGADVAITYFSDQAEAAKVRSAIEDCGRKALAVQCDVGHEDSVERLFDQVEQSLGPATWLVNSAGINMSGTPIVEMSV